MEGVKKAAIYFIIPTPGWLGKLKGWKLVERMRTTNPDLRCRRCGHGIA